MKYKHPGPTANRGTYAQGIKAMAKIQGKDILPEVRLPRKPREYKARGKYRSPEADLRNKIIKTLRKRGFRVWRIEPSVRGKFGVPDLLVYKERSDSNCFPPAQFTWVEVKAPAGIMSAVQNEFKSLCFNANVRHLVVRSVEEVGVI